MVRKTCDILSYERRGADFALVRIEADGTRSELLLTAANVVHLGMLAPGFAHRVLANKIGDKSGAIGPFLGSRMLRTNVRTMELLMGLLESRRWPLHAIMTEQRARRVASRLVEKADALAKRLPRPSEPAGSTDGRP